MHGVHEPVKEIDSSITVSLHCGGYLRVMEDGKGLYKLFYTSNGEHAEERNLGDVRKCSVESCIPLSTWPRGMVIKTKIGELCVNDKEEISRLKEWVKNSQDKETRI